MRYANIIDVDTANGVGVAVSIFFQGCSHHCKGCFNQETWNFDGGHEFTAEIENRFIELCKRSYVDCVSILGGEPFDQPNDLYLLTKRIKEDVQKPIYVWTGYLYEDLLLKYENILSNIDYLIDGEYVNEKRDFTLKLRGSSNQRIINVKARTIVEE